MWPQIIISSGKREKPRTPVQASEKSIRKKDKLPKAEREIFAELDAMVGLDCVKRVLHEVYAFQEIQKRRCALSLASEPTVFHMIFSGNPGTGKTTVARILGRILKEIGTLESGHIVEAERADLVGEYIGHTAQKTREKVKKAFGGVLFVDEAYSLARGGEKDFGRESIDVLVKAMEDHKNDFVLVLAGYPREMREFLRVNPGLSSRFPTHLTFDDYTEEELLEIAERFCAQREYRLSARARSRIIQSMNRERGVGGAVFGNARAVRNLVEKAIRRQAMRLLGRGTLQRQELMLLDDCDFVEDRIVSVCAGDNKMAQIAK